MMLSGSPLITYILQKRILKFRAAKKWVSQDSNLDLSNSKSILLVSTP